MGFCGAGEVDFTTGFFSSLSSHQSQIAIAATTRMITTMSGQLSLPSENDEAVSVFVVAGVGFVVAAGVGGVV